MSDTPVTESLPLLEWRRTAKDVEKKCPWPGPRPLDEDDNQWLLQGRDEDLGKFLDVVNESSVVILYGATGVGKSSLLTRGLIPKLERNGYFVARCREWSRMSAGSTTPAQYLIDHIYRDLDSRNVSDIGGSPLQRDSQLIMDLDDAYGSSAVLVLDQFEELIRDNPAFAELIYQAIIWLHRNTRLKIVISLRAEYVHELKPLERGVNPYQFGKYALEEIDDHYAVDVIMAGNGDMTAASADDDPDGPPPPPPPIIARTTAEGIAELWTAARSESHSTQLGDGVGDAAGTPVRVGLLHLQGLLYRLYFKCVGSDGTQPPTMGTGQLLTDDFVRAEREDLEKVGGGNAGVFHLALKRTIDLKLNRAQEQAEKAKFDPYMIAASSDRVASICRHLSFEGYKLVRGAFDLFGLTLDDSLVTLRRGIRAKCPELDEAELELREREVLEKLLDAVLVEVDADMTSWPASVTRWPHPGADLHEAQLELARIADDVATEKMGRTTTSWVDVLNEARELQALSRDGRSPDALARDAATIDPDDVSSGVLMGASPLCVLFEEMRRFVFALAWLRQTDLVRLNTAGEGSVRVALIHDGFADALTKWTASDVVSRCPAVYAVTASVGQEYDWNVDSSPFLTELQGESAADEDRHLTVDRDSIRYLKEFDGASGDAKKARIVLNQRWRGAWIRGHFRRVLFVNCDLRGSQFSSSTFEGVGFVNCLLDGVMFSDCAVLGVPEDQAAVRARDDWADRASEFTVPDAPRITRWLARYRGEPSPDGAELVASLPGAPATTCPAYAVPQRKAPLPTGGLVIQGGRTSNLMVRNCWFETFDGDPKVSTFSLRETAGSNFSVAEHHSRASYEIMGSALRHIEFTSSPVDHRTTEPLDVYVGYSTLAQLWIGADLSGTMKVVSSRVVQAWNGAAPDFDAVLAAATGRRSTRFQSLVGFRVEAAEHGEAQGIIDGEVPLGIDEADPAADTRDRAINMDYRRDVRRSDQADRDKLRREPT